MGTTSAMNRLFTKSAFKIALKCPRQLYYYYDSAKYANQNLEDEFLQSLAEGGFQVGELAKIYCKVPPENDLDKVNSNAAQLQKTDELMSSGKVVVAEAAFRHENLFVRADIVRKDGNSVNLVEVKAKSWESGKPIAKSDHDGKLKIDSNIAEYVYDVAFQKYVISLVHPEWKIKAFLMLADKTKTATVDGMNQRFRIVHDKNGRSGVELQPGAAELAEEEHVLTEFDVDADQEKMLHGMTFKDFVGKMSRLYCNHENEYVELSNECFKCPFVAKVGDNPDLKDGFKECWKEKAGLKDEDFAKPLIKDLWSGSGWQTRQRLFKSGKYRLADIKQGDITIDETKASRNAEERRLVQVALDTGRPSLVPLGYWRYVAKDGSFMFDFEQCGIEMSKWKYPLHMIDFETSKVALPFYKGMRPYETVAFQFSHHKIEDLGDGKFKISHAGQYINTKRGVFPNFEFVRALKRNLEGDGGTIFRYCHHENNVLNEIRMQLQKSNEPDKSDLIAFIESITYDKEGHRRGERAMVDLWELVKNVFYAPQMKGSYSIKAVLPAILNLSEGIKAKYSKPIYGGNGEVSSINIGNDKEPICLVETAVDENGKVMVLNPYKKLPDVRSYMPEDIAARTHGVDQDEDDAGPGDVNNGGAALAAYGTLQFCDEKSDNAIAIEKALLRYCELDTMAMVFIWEFFEEMIAASVNQSLGLGKDVFRLAPDDFNVYRP